MRWFENPSTHLLTHPSLSGVRLFCPACPLVPSRHRCSRSLHRPAGQLACRCPTARTCNKSQFAFSFISRCLCLRPASTFVPLLLWVPAALAGAFSSILSLPAPAWPQGSPTAAPPRLLLLASAAALPRCPLSLASSSFSTTTRPIGCPAALLAILTARRLSVESIPHQETNDGAVLPEAGGSKGVERGRD